MLEIFKILIEEPEKLRKTLIFLIKIILNCMIASYLYIQIVGNYTIISFKDLNGLASFLLSGRILVVILLYFVAYLIVEHIIPTFVLLPLNYIGSKYYQYTAPIEMGFFKWVFKKLNIIDAELETKQVIAGKNIEECQEFLSLYLDNESKSEFYSYKNSFLYDIIHTYIVFLVVYYILLDDIKYNGLNTLIIWIGILLLFLYLGICWFLDFMKQHAKKLSFDLQFLRLRKIAEDYLFEKGIHQTVIFNSEGNSKYDCFLEANGKNYYYEFKITTGSITEYSINYLIEHHIKKGNGVVLFSSGSLSKAAEEIVKEYPKSFIVIELKNEMELKSEIDILIRILGLNE